MKVSSCKSVYPCNVQYPIKPFLANRNRIVFQYLIKTILIAVIKILVSLWIST